MKRISVFLALLVVLCMVLSAGAFASGEPSGETGIVPGTYTDGSNVLVISEDGTFSMETVGQNMEGEDFVMIITGVVEDGAFVIDGLYDGDINVMEIATEDQIAENLATVEATYAAGQGASGDMDIVPGTYTDGTNTLVISEDGTFSMETVGQNMEGEDFVLIITGVVEDGAFVIDGLYDGDINVMEIATEDQIAENLATVEAAYAAGQGASGDMDIVPGTYTDGTNTLVISEDGTFSMETVGQNMEGEDFVLIITGVVEDGAFVIDGLYDGDINVMEIATEDQIAENLATVQAAYQG